MGVEPPSSAADFDPPRREAVVRRAGTFFDFFADFFADVGRGLADAAAGPAELAGSGFFGGDVFLVVFFDRLGLPFPAMASIMTTVLVSGKGKIFFCRSGRLLA
jgi:hypothetical protein